MQGLDQSSASGSAASAKPVELPLVVASQAKLANEARAGRGIDALTKILAEVKTHYADDEMGLLSAIDEMRQCATRHLVPPHEEETVETIFNAMFPALNSALDVVAINQDAEAEIQRLARLPMVQYERERIPAAGRLGIRQASLDKLVKSARPQDTKGQGRTFELLSMEPWPEPVNGAELLNEICAAISRYVVLPHNSVVILTLWALHTHCFDCFGHSPRAAITSPEKGCGKTTALDVLNCLVARPLPTSNATVSAIFRIIERDTPTLLIDEADTFLKENDELRGILNTGHRRGGQVTRTVGDDHEPRLFSTWAPAAIAIIGQLPDTLNDRSVVISLRRKKPSERVESFRSDRAEHLQALQRKMARFADDHRARLAAADPDMGELVNRVADNWRPLFAIADEVGGEWRARVRQTAGTAMKAIIEESTNAQLLADIKWIFDGGTPIDRIRSADLVGHLIEIEGRPWAEWRRGNPLTQNALARLLGKFEILPQTIRIGNDTAKGYYRSAFEDAFSRYLPPQTVTSSQLNNNGYCDALESVTPKNLVTVPKASQLNNDGHCDRVTLSKGNGGACAHCQQPETPADPLLQVGIDGYCVRLHRGCMDGYAPVLNNGANSR
jgi:hypothetical protein